MQMMLDAKNLKFADLDSLRRFPPFSRMSLEPRPYQGDIQPKVSVKKKKDTDFTLDPATESKINEKHTKLANEWRNQDSQDGFQILKIARDS